MEISETTNLYEHRNDPDVMKIIESSENPDPKYQNNFIHSDKSLLMIKRKFSYPEDSAYTKL